MRDKCLYPDCHNQKRDGGEFCRTHYATPTEVELLRGQLATAQRQLEEVRVDLANARKRWLEERDRALRAEVSLRGLGA